MGSLKLPSSGTVYVDTNCVIYSVERIEPFSGSLDEFWNAAARGMIQAATSELTVLESLVKPIKLGDSELEDRFRELLIHSAEVQLIPIDLELLESAARVRAQADLRTPDAIHAATGLQVQCTGFVTNDPGFKRVRDLPVILLESSG